jgi:spore germination protein YaaH
MALDDGVPKTKLINAIPFYAPIWTTTGGGTPQLKLCGMQDIQNYISEHGMTETWDADVGQNYAERTDGDSLIQIWVEDAKSIKEKLDVMQADDIAGVAEWRLQFETADVWDVIADYMNS